MNKSEYDKYYKKGGTYVIPVELFNELLDELEELKKNQRLTQEKRNHLHLELDEMVESLQNQLQQKENIIKEVREDLHQVVKWCTENKHNENTIERYLVVDYGTIVGKINEIIDKINSMEVK